MIHNGDTADQDEFNNAFVSRTDPTDAAILKVTGSFGLTPTDNNALTGSAKDLSVTTPINIFRNAGLASIRSIVDPTRQVSGILILRNYTGVNITLQNEVAGATAANRIQTGTGTDLIVGDKRSVLLMYDTVNSRWCVIGTTGSAQKVFTLVNNQGAAADVTGAVFDGATYRAIEIKWTAWRSSVGGLTRVQSGSLLLVYDGTNWSVTDGPFSSAYDAGLTFTISNAAGVGQIQYQSDDNTGAYLAANSKLTWEISRTVGV